MPISYKTHLWCAKCGEYVLISDLPKHAFLDKSCRLLHECGWAFRLRGRRHNNIESQREDSRRHRSPIQFKLRGGNQVKSDILANKDKWEKLIAKI